MNNIFHSLDPACRFPLGAVQSGTEMRFSAFLPSLQQVSSLQLAIYAADRWDEPAELLPMEYVESDLRGSRYVCSYTPKDPGLFFYCFLLRSGQKTLQIRRGVDGGSILTAWGEGDLWQLTVYRRGFDTPAWLKGAVIYQIFPDRFCRSGAPKENIPADRLLREDWGGLPQFRPNAAGEITNSDYFGGDLRGICEKLPYLRSLGVTVLYLNPIFEAHSNHRYNTADYLRIDPLLGDEEDLRTLCAEAKACGIRVVLDGVFSHTGSDSRYFNREGRYGEHTGAYRDPESPYRSWYKFEEYPHRYRSWWNFETLPEVIEENEDYLKFICGENGVIAHWMHAGVSGFRLDVADELPDCFLDAMTAAVKREDPEGCVIGEVWEDASNKISYGQRRHYLLGEQLDSVMNYPFGNAILDYIAFGDANGFLHTVRTVCENYPKPVRDALMNSISTHDTERAITRLVGESGKGHDREWQAANDALSQEREAQGRRLVALAGVLQYLLPGVPCLYYGDEVGLTGYRDPFNRKCFPWGSEADDPLCAHFARLGRLRAENPFLKEAELALHTVSPSLCVFTRYGEGRELLAAVNRSGEAQPLPLPPQFAGCTPEVLQGSYADGMLAPYSAVIILR